MPNTFFQEWQKYFSPLGYGPAEQWTLLLRSAACSWLSTQIEKLGWSCATGGATKV